jgi:hypothetical protein
VRDETCYHDQGSLGRGGGGIIRWKGATVFTGREVCRPAFTGCQPGPPCDKGAHGEASHQAQPLPVLDLRIPVPPYIYEQLLHVQYRGTRRQQRHIHRTTKKIARVNCGDTLQKKQSDKSTSLPPPPSLTLKIQSPPRSPQSSFYPLPVPRNKSYPPK